LIGGSMAVLVVLVGLSVGAYFILKEPAPQPVAATPKPEPSAPTTPAKDPPVTTRPAPKPADPPKPVDPPKPAPPPPMPKPPAPKPAAPKVVKLPVPDEAEQARAEKALKDTFKAEYAKTKPEDRLVLSAKFLQPGREDRKDPAAWFVLLREARDLAVMANRPRLAVEAIEEIDKWFIVDPLDMKVKALTAVSKSGNDIITVAARYRTTLNLIQQAYDAENFPTARRFVEIVEEAVREIKATDLLRLVLDQKAEMDVYFKDYEAVLQARERLAKLPDDPEANLTVGRYLCFFQAKWEEGLPLLSKGADAALKDLSGKELSQPADVKDQLGIADGWWGKVKGQRDRHQRNIVKHARSWYERAGPGTAGEDRTKVIARIREAQEREYARINRMLPGSFFGRDTESRILLLREGGGNMRSEEAVERGLEWLSKHQSTSGAWTTDAFHVAGQCKCTDHGEKHNIAGTAFGMLPFLGAGETHRQGKYFKNIASGLNYLLGQQKVPGGNFHDNAYENALATIVVVELYGLTKDPRLRIPAQAATNYIVRAQHENGSWGYSAGSKGDTSVCGWQFTALKAAAYAKLDVPPETFNRLSGFLDSVADSGGQGYGYSTPGAGTSTSAVGILCREFLSWGPGHPGLDKSADFLLRPDNFPAKDKISMYAVFYITQVAHHLGGRHWEKWNHQVRDLLIELQDLGDTPKLAHQKGSWAPRADPYAKQGGRLMFTSLSLIALEAYYYHIPLYGYGPYVLLD
jgi:hypothetical protein